MAAQCSAAVAPLPVVLGGEGGGQAGNEGKAKLGYGVAASVVAGKGAPPWFSVDGRDRTELALKDGPSLAMALPPLW